MTCWKIKYTTRIEADHLRRKAHAEGKGSSGHVYRCEACGYWHTTHHSKAEWRRIKRKQAAE